VERYTIERFHKDFPDDDTCLEWLVNHLYPDGIHCKKCGKVTGHHKISGRRCYSCAYCGTQVHPTADTIFHKSDTPLVKWFYAVYRMSSTRCGISAKQLQRELGVTYKTAWRMAQQIRNMLKEDVGKLSGEVEMDETYIGGKRSGGKRGRGAPGKTIVAGAVQRGKDSTSKIVAKTVPDVKGKTLMPMMKEFVLPQSMVYTDELLSYRKAESAGYQHRRVHHNQKVFVIGNAHTNTIENFWSQFKRSIDGTHHVLSKKYLQRYLDEFTFRYNHRADRQNLFTSWLKQVYKAPEMTCPKLP